MLPAVLHFLPVLALLAPAGGNAKSVELSSSALMFYTGDLQREAATGISPCELYVKRAAAHGSRKVQLVPTHYW
jgi:hypothetical protein